MYGYRNELFLSCLDNYFNKISYSDLENFRKDFIMYMNVKIVLTGSIERSLAYEHKDNLQKKVFFSNYFMNDEQLSIYDR